MNHVKRAVQAVKQEPSRIVLLAIEPHEPETEYGYVVPHGDVGELGTRRVSAFIEKPKTELASELVMAGGLWNTMTMVFKAHTLLQLVRSLHPALYLHFCCILDALGTREERVTIDQVYENLEPINFSKQILERIAVDYPRSISVLPVSEVFWSDLGSRERVLRVRRRLGQDRIREMEAVPASLKANGRRIIDGGMQRKPLQLKTCTARTERKEFKDEPKDKAAH